MLTDSSGTGEDTTLNNKMARVMKKLSSLAAAQKFCEFTWSNFVAKPDNCFNLSPVEEREGNSALWLVAPGCL